MRTVLLLALVGCTSDPISTDEILDQTDPVGVHGTIVHEVDAPHTGKGAFAVTPTSFATVTVLAAVSGEDGPALELAKTTLPITGLPAEFTLLVPPDKIAEARAMLADEVFFGAIVQQTQTPRPVVGDLLLETRTAAMPVDAVTLVVTKLEACTDPDAGGFCTSE